MNVRYLVLFNFLQLICAVFAGFPTAKIGRAPLWNATVIDKLKQDLLLNYDKFSRPTQHTNVTTVRVGMDIKHVEVNEFKSTFTVSGWTRLVWTDSKLKWDEDRYGGIGHIKVAPHEIWQPDLVLYNSAVTTGLSQESLNLLVYSNGEILWVPTAQLPVLCDFNFLHWPFDTQVCVIVIGCWSYHGSHVDLVYYGNDENSIVKDIHIEATGWNITDIVYTKSLAKYDCCENPYPLLEITIYLRRISSSYKTLIAAPTFVIIILTLLSFWFSPNSGEKILLNSITAFITIAFMMYFLQKIPIMGSHTPLIVQFYSSSLVAIAFSLINAVLVIYMSRTQHNVAVPWFIKNALISRLGTWLGLSNYILQATVSTKRLKAEEIRDHQVTGLEDESATEKQLAGSTLSVKYQQDWILLAAAVDRISFVFYSLLFTILASKYSF